ncbi:methyltransferase [Nocardiopsis sp. TSRI0078]|uniref:methyltransferase n=1 Tax=unclassified Nocardiopsis TaxID=2649073 RepID=UPI00093EDB30|nr:methyltransferase [Nocardiopsis sp. TSRI0078]OKI23641.1 methyltransferase [Nocardiopsis sp. TSRI0078]
MSDNRNDRVAERFQLIANGPALFNAVVSGLELGVFDFLAKSPDATADDVQRFVGIPRHKLRILMFALCSTELVERVGGRYRNSEFAQDNLASAAPDSWRHILIGWQRIYYPAFAHMTAGLSQGTNEAALAAYGGTSGSLYERLSEDPETEAVFHTAMSAFTLRSMDSLIESSALSGVRKLLDVGGGAGTTAIRFLERYPDAVAGVFDLPSVLRQAREDLPEGVADRMAFHPGDLFGSDLPGGYDAILFSHVLEVFSEERIRALLAKAFDALPSGGSVVLYGYNATDDETAGVISARLSLYLNVLASGEGMAYPAADYLRWLEEAGFARTRSWSGLPYEHGLQIGMKP